MNIPKSVIAPFEPLGLPVLNTMEPPLHNWQEDLIHRIRRSPTRTVWYLGLDAEVKHGWTAGPSEGVMIFAPYIPLSDAE
jgi:hypothetical protein